MSELSDIDQHNLEEECLVQPKMYEEHAKALVEAKRMLIEQTARVELAKEELATDIRRHPDKYQALKITEAVVAELVPTTERYQKVSRVWRKRKHEVEVHQAAVNTLDHRRRTLENLVTLWRSDYYAAPRTRDENSRETMEDAKRERVKVKIKRRKRRPE